MSAVPCVDVVTSAHAEVGKASAPCTWYAIHGPNGDLTWRVTGPADLVGAKLRLIPEAEGMDVAYPNDGDYFPWRLRAVEEDGTESILTSETAWKEYVKQPRRLTSLETVYTGQ